MSTTDMMVSWVLFEVGALLDALPIYGMVTLKAKGTAPCTNPARKITPH
jgi:hypothetical protein